MPHDRRYDPIDLFGNDSFRRFDGLFGRPGEVEKICKKIIDSCVARAELRAWGSDQGERRRRDPAELSFECTLLFAMIDWFARHQRPLPPIVLTTLAHMFGLYSVATQRLLPHSGLARLLDFPARIHQPDKFTQAAALEAEWSVAGRRVNINALARQVGVPRSSLRRWRNRPDYRRLVTNLARVGD